MPLLLLLGASESYRFPRFPVRIVDPSISRGGDGEPGPRIRDRLDLLDPGEYGGFNI